MQKSDCIWLLFTTTALAFSLWGLPYSLELGRPAWAALAYAFFLAVFLYGSANWTPPAARLPKRSQQRK
jgi:hypothetical protein